MTHSWHKSVWSIAFAPFAAWKRDPMVWGLAYAFLLELTGAAVLMLTILGSLTFGHLLALQINDDPGAALAALGLLVLLCSCGEYCRTDAYGDRH